MQELLAWLTEIGTNREVRAVILAAAGKVFSSGHDLSEMTGCDINGYRRLFDVCTDLMTRIQSIPQPVIAEVQGIATAAGFGSRGGGSVTTSPHCCAPTGRESPSCPFPRTTVTRSAGSRVFVTRHR